MFLAPGESMEERNIGSLIKEECAVTRESGAVYWEDERYRDHTSLRGGCDDPHPL